MSRLAFLRPPRLGRVVLVAIPALIVLAIGVGIAHIPPSSGKTSPVQNTPSASVSASVSPTPPDASRDTVESDQSTSLELDAATRQNITQAIRIWAAYPNQKGRLASLAKLRLNRSVSAGALKAIGRAWDHPQAELVNVTISSVVVESLPVFVSGTDATLVGEVIAAKQFRDGKTTHARIPVDVQLKKVGGVWQIAQLSSP